MSSIAPRPVRIRKVDPDPSITSAIGRHHSLATAVADLVDNSVDAGARNILIRFVLRDGRPVGLQVIDDGRGMDSVAVDDAMAYARRRDYGEVELGHFGIGLKAASLSQADELIVWSRRYGAPAVGRGLKRSTIDTGPMVEEYETSEAEQRLRAMSVDFAFPTGTVVEWAGVRSFPRPTDHADQQAWLETATRTILTHLGLVLHRILERGGLEVSIDHHDEFGSGIPRTVQPLDPFGYDHSGAIGYPMQLPVELPDGRTTASAHIWPSAGRSAPGYVLRADGPIATQGLYVYRNDRLLQAGGWDDLAMSSDSTSLARLAIEVGPETERHITINPEKTGVVLDGVFKDALHRAATADGRTLRDFLQAAKGEAKRSRRRQPRPIVLVEPVGGLPGSVVNAYAEAVDFDPDEMGIRLRWSRLSTAEFFRIDRDDRTLTLNLLYREAVVGRRSLDPADAPLVKALLHLLVDDHFRGSYPGAREKRVESAWQAILVAAAQVQQQTLQGDAP